MNEKIKCKLCGIDLLNFNYKTKTEYHYKCLNPDCNYREIRKIPFEKLSTEEKLNSLNRTLIRLLPENKNIADILEGFRVLRAHIKQFLEDKNWGLEKDYILECIDAEIRKWHRIKEGY